MFLCCRCPSILRHASPRVRGLQGFLPRQVAASSHSPGAADEAFEGVFRTFPQIKKKVRGWVRTRGPELAADSSPSTRRAYGVSMAVEEDESEPVTESELDDDGDINAWVDDSGDSWVLLALFTLGFWTLLLRARVSGKRLPRCFGVNPWLLLEEFQMSLGDSARAVRTGKSVHVATLFCAILGSTVDTGSSTVLGGFWANFQCFLREGEFGSCGRFTSCSSGFSGRAVWRGVHSRCFDFVDCLSLWHLGSGHYLHEPLQADRHLAAVSGLQVMSSISLSDCRCIDRCRVAIHTHQVVSETTTTTTTITQQQHHTTPHTTTTHQHKPIHTTPTHTAHTHHTVSVFFRWLHMVLTLTLRCASCIVPCASLYGVVACFTE